MKPPHHSGARGSSTWRRYWLFQVPGTVATGLVLAALARWRWIETTTAVIGLALWVAKDLALYPLVRRAYEKTAPTFPSKLVGRIGKARDALAPMGYVSIDGELWRARTPEGGERVDTGDEIIVCGYDDKRLIVRPVQGADRSRST